MENIRSLDDFIRSQYFEAWDSDNRSTGGCGIILSDPERFDRISKAAENGGEGSTHAEIIQDWRNALVNAPLNACTKRKIELDIDKCEAWHESNGTFNQEIG